MRFFLCFFCWIFYTPTYGYAPQNFHSVETEELESSEDPIIGGFFYDKHTDSACYFHARREFVPSRFTKVDDSLTIENMQLVFPGLPPCDPQELDFLRWAALNTDSLEEGPVQVAGIGGAVAGRVFQWLTLKAKAWPEVLHNNFPVIFPSSYYASSYSAWWRLAATSGIFGCGLGMINGLFFHLERMKLDSESRKKRKPLYTPTPYINDQGLAVPYMSTEESVLIGSIAGILTFTQVTGSLYKSYGMGEALKRGGFLGFISGTSLTGAERGCSNLMYQIPFPEKP